MTRSRPLDIFLIIVAIVVMIIIFTGCKDSAREVMPDMVSACRSHNGIQTMAIDGYSGPNDSGVVCKDQTAFYYDSGSNLVQVP